MFTLNRLSRIQFLAYTNISMILLLTGSALSYFLIFKSNIQPMYFQWAYIAGWVLVFFGGISMFKFSIQRFRDISMSGFPVLTYLTPLAPLTYLLLLILPGNKGKNKYGELSQKPSTKIILYAVLPIPAIVVSIYYLVFTGPLLVLG